MTSFDDDHGRCAIVHIEAGGDIETALADLPAQEHARARTLGAPRQREFIAGRTALRALLAQLASPDEARAQIAADDRGAPVLPPGWVGSLSHKRARAAAILGPDTGARIGIDLELAGPPRLDIGSRVLTARERDAIAALGPGSDAHGRAVTLRFAIKEAIYKAIDPFVRRYVGFTEVELDVSSDGSCEVTILDPSRLPVNVAARWREVDGHWLATAKATSAS